MAPKDDGRTYLPNSSACFVCGEENPAGLRTRFYVEDEVVKVALNAQPHHCGYENVVHGGVTAAALDECMGWAAARAIGRMCVTAEMTVRYLRPVRADHPVTVCAKVVRTGSRMAQVEGSVVDDEGLEYARSQGTFMPLSVAETLAVDDQLLYQGGEERIFDVLRD